MTCKTCHHVPAWPRYICLLGTLPFFLLALASWPRGHWQLISQDALLVYAALILTIIGVMHLVIANLGTARRLSLGYRWSILASLMGWGALLLPPLPATLALLLGFWLHYMQDRRLSGGGILPTWYLPMRFGLTAAASIALLLGAAAIVLGGVAIGPGLNGVLAPFI